MKKVLSLLLAVMMVISLCPITALADETNPIELQQVEAQEEQQEEPIPEPSEEQTTEEQPGKPQQSEMNTLDLTGEAAPLAEGSANGGYYTESGAVIAFDENGISGCNYTVDKTPHTVATDTETTVSKTYIIRMREANFSFRNDGKDKATLYSANNDGLRVYFESEEQKPFENLSSFKQIELNRIAQSGTKYDLTNAKEVYFAYIQRIGDKNVGVAILIEIIPDSIKVNGSEFTAEKTELTGWNRIKSDGSTEKVECNNIYMTTLAYGDESLSLDFNGAVKYAGQALGSERTEFGNIRFTELFANSDYAVTGDNKAEGVSASTLFGEALPASLSENDKIVFVAGYDAEDNAKAGIIIRIKNVQKISTVEEFVAFRDSVNAGATNIDVKLMADIDLSSVCGEGIGSWTPIEGFAGTFDGNGHTISNLYVANNTDDAALFGTTAEGSIIKNLGVVSAKIIRTAKVGNPKSAIFAVTIGGEVDSCYTKDCAITVYGTWGSLFCNSNLGSISNCYVIGGVVTDLASGKYIKSFANFNNNKKGTVSNCYAAKVTLKTDATITADTFLNANKGLSNCYVLDSDNNTIKKVTVKDEAWFKSDEAIAALGGAWEKDNDNKNGGFPVLKSQKNSGSDKPAGKNNGIFTVQLEDGTEVYPEELAKPESINWGGSIYPKDITYYEDGIWKITVPAGTSKLKFSVDNLKNLAGVENKTDYTFFVTWRGSLQGGWSEGKTSELQIDPDYLGAEEMNEYGITTLPDYKDYCYETEYKDGFYTIPLEQLMRDPADMKDVEKQVWGELDSQYKYAVVFIGTHDKGRPICGYDTMVLVQIGGSDSGENTPPVRRNTVPASFAASVDEKLQYTVDLSNVFYDEDGDALTYKVRLGTDGEYVPFEGSTYTHTLTDWSGETLYFTANDGKTDGGSYIVKLSVPRDVLIAICEAIVADPSDYWTENDRWDGTTYTGERYKHFVQQLDSYKRPNTSESYYKNALIEAYKKLMPKSKVNATCLYEEYSRVEDTSKYTDVSVSPYLEALAAVKALYAEGAIVNEPYTEEKQAEIDRVAAACREAREKLVLKTAYKKAFEYYQKNKDEAEKLLELYDPAKYTESDYTAESWQVFVSAWNDLKADVDFVFDEESGSVREYEMLNSFEAHMNALSQKFSELVSAVDITVSFKYIENMHFRYEEATAGTDGYYNAAMALKAGETTVMDAVNISGRTLYTFASTLAQVKEGMFRSDAALDYQPLYALFVNDVYAATGHIGVDNAATNIGSYQLHNGDRVVLARITPQFIGYEVSSGYDSTAWGFSASAKPEGIEKSVGLIDINSVTQNAKVGDSVTIKVNAKTAYPSNLGKRLNAEGLTLMVSEPSEDNVISQNWQKTVFATSAMGTVDYVFTEPGYYTVAIVNNKYDEPTVTNVYGVTTVGTYNTLMIGDFTTVYIAPADDDEALIAEWREKNLAEAKAYFEQFKYYDFDNGVYEDTIVPMYKALVANQKNAKTFKELINSYNSDFAELQSTVNKNLRNHKVMVEELRGYLRYIPNDLSEMNYSYSSVVREIKKIYGGMNDYEKNLLSDKERALAEKIMLLDENNLPTGKKVAIDVQKDANIILMGGYGWLTSAPNENIVYKFIVGYGKSQKYYQWTTGGGVSSSGNNVGAEPSDKDMTAYPGDHVHARRLVATSDDAYWMVFSYDGGNTWNLSTKVDGGEGMFSADFTMPETDADTLVFALKMVSKAEYEKMKLNAETPEMALEEAQAAYKAALEEAFASYDRDRYAAENYTTIRYAKEDGITNINKAKTVTAVVNYFNIALEAMKAVPQKAQVYVEVKNETFTESYVDDDGNTINPPWKGTLVAEWVDIDEDSTMMSSIVKALGNHGYVAVGAENNYISSINGLGEFGGGSGSGWMGTLNDWFTNLGFGEFSVANGTLKAGDRISVLYTQTLGSDIGGAVEGNTDTSLKALSATNGTLAPAFDKETTSYLLTMDEGKHTVTLNYTANNKAFQVRTYLNQYTPSSDDYYACGETISVKEGDIIYVACGDPIWPSMAGNDSLTLVPHVYEITVVGSSGAVEKLIKALPAPEKLEYSDKGDVENAERLFDALGEDEQAKLDEQLKAKLRKCIERMTELERVNAVEELIAALPAKLPISDEEKVKVDEAKDAFDALGEELQKDVKSVYTNKLLSLLGQQKIYFDYQGGKENTKLLFTQKDGKLAVLPGTTKENYHFDGWYTEKDGGTQISLETIFTESCKLYAHWLDNAQYVEKLISAIGEVELTDECKERIDAARAAVDALSEEDKVNVSNYEVLLDAEAEYQRLLDQKKADEAAAKAVDNLIAAIGKVEFTDESKGKIDAARAAYDKLTDAQKKLVKNLKVLTDAEAEYQRLLDQHKADEAAAKAVDDMVNKLQPVTVNSGKAIEAARRAFDALTPAQKKLLDPKTEGKLVAAENEYKVLIKDNADEMAAKEVEDKIARLQPVTKDSGEAIKDARSSYEALTPEQKALVSKDSVAALEKAEKLYNMIIASNKPGTAVGDNTGSTSGSGVIKITANADSKGEKNPNTGAPVMSMVPAVLVLAAAALVLKKRG